MTELTNEQKKAIADAQATFEDIKNTSEPLNEKQLDLLFGQARSMNGWLSKEVSDDMVKSLYELTKMGVKKSLRNKGVGKLLLKKCIEKVTENELKKVIIYSNRKLENAIYLYKSFGFTEVELEKKSNYKRADLKLELDLQ